MKLTDKTIVITGGTSGIGYQLVKILSQHNRLLVIARPSDRLLRLQLTDGQQLRQLFVWRPSKSHR